MPARRAGAVAAGGGLVTVLSVLDPPALLALLTVAAMALAATCWVVADQERPKRLALLIRTLRGPAAPPPGTRPALPPASGDRRPGRAPKPPPRR